MAKKKIPRIMLVALIVMGVVIGSSPIRTLDQPSTNREEIINPRIRTAQTSHVTIDIDGNVALATFCNGNGTDGLSWETAFHITNLSITEGDESGVYIQNTDKFLILSHLQLEGFRYEYHTTTYYSGMRESGIMIQNCSNIMIQNCTLLDSNYGIYIDTSTNVSIVKNEILVNSHGICLRNSHNNSIFNNSAIGSFYQGITFYNSNYNLVDTCTISNDTIGVFIHNSRENTIRGNLITNNTISGIEVLYYHDQPMNRNNYFSNNTFVDNAEDIRYLEIFPVEPTEDQPITDFSGLNFLVGAFGFILVLFLLLRINSRQSG